MPGGYRAGPGWQRRLGHFPSRPSDLNSAGLVRHGQNKGRAVLGPIPAASVEFPRGSQLLSEAQSHGGTDPIRVAYRPAQSHAKARLRSHVPEKFRGTPMLGQPQIHAAVPIEIRHGGAPLLAIDQQAALLPGHGSEMTPAISE